MLDSAKAIRKSIRISPRKLGLIVGLIRGKTVGKALDHLKFCQKKAAVEVLKALNSAIANAENNHNLDVDRLVVTEALVGQGLVLKRFHARAKGRGAAIKKYFSHLSITVTEQGTK